VRGPAPLHIALGCSRLAAAIVALAGLASAALIAILPFEPLYRALAVAAIGAYAIRVLRFWALHASVSSIVGVELLPDGRAVLVERSGRRREGKVSPASYVGTWLVTLAVRYDGANGSRAVAILADMIPGEEMRRLRVLLRVIGSLKRDGPEP
jgi:hypothetical protein